MWKYKGCPRCQGDIFMMKILMKAEKCLRADTEEQAAYGGQREPRHWERMRWSLLKTYRNIIM
jgi:hypothetical protein